MLRTFRALIKDNYVEWDSDANEQITTNSPVSVFITVLDNSIASDDISCRGKRMASALNQLAKIRIFRDIGDPVTWQREVRQDRQLPGRHDAD